MELLKVVTAVGVLFGHFLSVSDLVVWGLLKVSEFVFGCFSLSLSIIDPSEKIFRPPIAPFPTFGAGSFSEGILFYWINIWGRNRAWAFLVFLMGVPFLFLR